MATFLATLVHAEVADLVTCSQMMFTPFNLLMREGVNTTLSVSTRIRERTRLKVSVTVIDSSKFRVLARSIVPVAVMLSERVRAVERMRASVRIIASVSV